MSRHARLSSSRENKTRHEEKSQSKNLTSNAPLPTPRLPFYCPRRADRFCPQKTFASKDEVVVVVKHAQDDVIKETKRKKRTRMKRRHATNLLLPTECTRTAKFPYTNAYRRIVNRQHIPTTISRSVILTKKKKKQSHRYPCSISILSVVFVSLPYRPFYYFFFLFSFWVIVLNHVHYLFFFKLAICWHPRHYGECDRHLPRSTHPGR